jgi:ribosomal-protein-alanine N-acetyltransferase
MINLNFTQFPALTTQRLILRQITDADINEFYILKSDERLLKGYHGKPKTYDEARLFLKRLNEEIKTGESITWGIALKADNKLIGSICYWNINSEESKAEIGYELMHDWHGKGIMREALKSVAQYGFDVMRLEVIEALPYSAHTASVKLLEKCGFLKVREFSDAGEDTKQSEFILKQDNI